MNGFDQVLNILKHQTENDENEDETKAEMPNKSPSKFPSKPHKKSLTKTTPKPPKKQSPKSDKPGQKKKKLSANQRRRKKKKRKKKKAKQKEQKRLKSAIASIPEETAHSADDTDSATYDSDEDTDILTEESIYAEEIRQHKPIDSYNLIFNWIYLTETGLILIKTSDESLSDMNYCPNNFYSSLPKPPKLSFPHQTVVFFLLDPTNGYAKDDQIISPTKVIKHIFGRMRLSNSEQIPIIARLQTFTQSNLSQTIDGQTFLFILLLYMHLIMDLYEIKHDSLEQFGDFYKLFQDINNKIEINMEFETDNENENENVYDIIDTLL